MEKSSIHFAKGVRQQSRDVIKNEVEVYNEAFCEKYLGMGSNVGIATNGAYKYYFNRNSRRVPCFFFH